MAREMVRKSAKDFEVVIDIPNPTLGGSFPRRVMFQRLRGGGLSVSLHVSRGTPVFEDLSPRQKKALVRWLGRK